LKVSQTVGILAPNPHHWITTLADVVEVLRTALAERYAIERELGRGGMATVFLAQDVKHKRSVAIKVLDEDVGHSIGAERFLREIETLARLQHPHILPLYDSGAAEDFLYYVMPFVEGETLRSKLDREKQLSLEDALKCTAQVASALSYAHTRGIVHRDIKPENIMLSQGTAVLADFGIARSLSGNSDATSLTQAGSIIGTPLYMSPEQIMGDPEIDGRSDQYSLACVLYEMLVGAPPFTGPTPHAVMARHSMDIASPPSIVRSTIPPGTEDAIMRALAKLPADRFPTISQFAEALDAPSVTISGRYSSAARAALTSRGTRAFPTPGAVTLTVKRRSLLMGGVGIALAALVLVGFGVWYRGTRTRATASAGGLDPKRIAVLYFGDLSSDKHLGYIADGFTESLIDELSRVPELSVVSRGGAGAWRQSDVAADSVGRALQAGTLVEGRVEAAAGDKIRVQVWLVDGNSGVDLGKRASFERSVTDLVGARDSVAAQAAELIRRQLGQEVRLRSQHEGTQSTAAWSLLQQAELLGKSGESAAASGDTLSYQRDFQQADSLLVKAEKLDEKWPDPIVSQGRLAYLRSRRNPGDAGQARKWIDTGMSHVNRALAVAGNDADALELRGNLQYWKYLLRLEQDTTAAAALRDRARKDFEEATRIRPTQAGAWASLSHLYNNDPSAGATDAMLAARRAYESDAFLANAPQVLARLFYAAYDLDQPIDAAHWCTEGSRRFPKEYLFTLCHIYLMTMRGAQPDIPRAWRLADSVAFTRGQTGGAPAFQEAQARMWVAAALARAGLKDSSRAVAKRALAAAGADVDPSRFLYKVQAIAFTLIDDKPAAIQSLKTYLAANPERRREFRDDSGWLFRSLANEQALKDVVGTR
jgi:serine/threonine-protein kinase